MDRFDVIMCAILLVIIIGLVGIVFIAISNPSIPPTELDHKFLATEISRLHDDVRLLQTQVGPKQ